jgi:hypothetical protein
MAVVKLGYGNEALLEGNVLCFSREGPISCVLRVGLSRDGCAVGWRCAWTTWWADLSSFVICRRLCNLTIFLNATESNAYVEYGGVNCGGVSCRREEIPGRVDFKLSQPQLNLDPCPSYGN